MVQNVGSPCGWIRQVTTWLKANISHFRKQYSHTNDGDHSLYTKYTADLSMPLLDASSHMEIKEAQFAKDVQFTANSTSVSHERGATRAIPRRIVSAFPLLHSETCASQISTTDSIQLHQRISRFHE